MAVTLQRDFAKCDDFRRSGWLVEVFQCYMTDESDQPPEDLYLWDRRVAFACAVLP
jgi:hypothetical protein